MIAIPKVLKFEAIYRLLWRNKKLKVTILCTIVNVSVSWYYKHRKLIITHNTKQNREKQDVESIKMLCLQYKRKHWYRMITMLLKWELNIIMNHKKVLRLMNKYNLLSTIRKKDPYSKIRKADQKHRTHDNLLNREFRWSKPFTKLWTDITYIDLNWKWCYLSLVKDMVSWEVLSAQVSTNMWLWFVHKSLGDLEHLNLEWTLLHSDQWFQYTHPSYSKVLKSQWIIQSMSRKWNCIDNSPTESFFWHMKDEIDTSTCKTFKELEKYIKNYIFYYNNDRPQWNRKKMTPVQYRNHLLNN